jgi:hypothetical protein
VTDASDAEDQAIARALDAESEARTPDADPRLVDEYRAVLGQLPVDEVAPPPALEDRIVAAAAERRPPTRKVAAIGSARSRRVRRLRVGVLAAAVAAAVVVGVVLVTVKSPTPMPSGHVSLATVRRAEIESRLRAPGARMGVFAGGGKVVLAENGNGAVYDLTGAAPLSIGLVSSGGTTAIGPTPPRAGVIAFVVDHPERVRSVTLIRGGSVIASAELNSR